MFVKELLKKYNGKTVVDGVSFELPKGKVISLIGPNGAGKSTVMGMISRLIAQDDGSVDFEGKDMSKWKSRDLARRLAILTQSNHVQMKLTVRELVAFGRFPYSGNRITAEDEEIIEKAIAYMEQNYYLDLDLSMISDLISMNSSYFSSLFKKKTGLNLINYLQNVRIEKSKQLLLNTNQKLYEISEDVRIPNVKYFCKLFKDYTGVTPSEFRKKEHSS